MTGVILDGATNHPIAGARVRIEEFPANAVVTASDGSFRIRSIRKWELVMIGTDSRPGYRIVAEASGYLVAHLNWDIGDDRPQVLKLQRGDAN